ncbi:MAG TPA: cytochrome c peroxidase [Methylomirabilota bacterium]|jgi:cytochrome c peroxidase
MISATGRAGLNVLRIVFATAGLAGMAPWSCVSAADEGLAAKPSFSDAEIKSILTHGPWPTPVEPDPSNRVSRKPDAIELGMVLFFDQRLSSSGKKACATCHVPERNWTDNLPRGIGMAPVDRNTPTLMNLRGQRWYGWDGAADSLWSQSLRPIQDARELAATPRQVAKLLRSDEGLSCRYRRVFGAPPSPTDDETVFVNVGKVLAAFEETLVSGRTPFDEFRDALARGASPSAQTYSAPAQRGLQIFIGKGGCSGCHSGANFTSGEFFRTSFSRVTPLGKPDPGRAEGIRQLRESRFNLLGSYSDNPSRAADEQRIVLASGSDREFKVPTLRNLMLTAPYGHDGDVDTIAEVVRRHAGDGRSAGAPSFTLREQTDLVVFLESLSTFANPWRPEDPSRCD